MRTRTRPSPFVLPLLACVLLLAACGRGDQAQEVEPPRPGPIEEVVVTAPPPDAAPPGPMPLPPLFRDIEKRTFQFFWDTTDERNGMTPDRFPSRPFASVAAIGFALTAYPIGIENGWISRRQAVDRTLLTLEFLLESPQGPAATGTIGHRGFFYHFLDMRTGHRYEPWVELSSVDTGLMMLGVLFAQAYYDSDEPREQRIRELADALYRRIEWPWLQVRPPLVSMGWYPESGFIEHDWTGYDEAMLVYILALGSPTHPVEPEAWTTWTKTYDDSWGIYQGQEYLSFAPHFGHQYSHAWIDFRGIRDAYMRDRGIDYFENSRRATYAQRSYAIENPMGWKGYGPDIWGLTASDGPQRTDQDYNGQMREFRHYSARGAGIAVAFDDGTIAPTAAIASLPYAPELVVPATEALVEHHGEYLYSSYGFLDSFNPSFEYDIPLKTGRIVPGKGWVASDYIGIDQGPILIGIANYRSGFVWEVMKRSPYIRRGLERAGFTGGWLAELQAGDAAGEQGTGEGGDDPPGEGQGPAPDAAGGDGADARAPAGVTREPRAVARRPDGAASARLPRRAA
ncbi:glucoamylase family protein [Luteimonas sp. MC1895]|uniref:glucoamylase family protein n=1 Tax=Luteimonas sp. MC1895 TaxID=2819513 RepID=UPI0018F0B2F6|nr:glucoamylase family protein [Luteimonas sp. MC1895]MBJ6977719.1 hypothetical protein [Luteimonas sp. MC1895]